MSTYGVRSRYEVLRTWTSIPGPSQEFAPAKGCFALHRPGTPACCDWQHVSSARMSHPLILVGWTRNKKCMTLKQTYCESCSAAACCKLVSACNKSFVRRSSSSSSRGLALGSTCVNAPYCPYFSSPFPPSCPLPVFIYYACLDSTRPDSTNGPASK